MLKFIPLRIRAGIAGFESPAAEYAELGLTLDQILVDHPAATYLGRVEGTSMQGAGIFPGDILVVSRAETVRSGDVIVACLNGEFVCKRVDIERRQLLSASAQHPAYTLTAEDDFTVEGVVTRSIRLHRPLTRGLP